MPAQISSYRLEGEIARGGMGIVYRGVHEVFQEVVAIKAIFPELMLSADLRERFLNEARIQRQLQHPNIVQIREFLAIQDRFYIVMELVKDAESGALVKTLTGHGDRVTSVAFRPDGRLLASGSADSTIRFWDVNSGTEKQTLRGHAGWVRSVASVRTAIGWFPAATICR